MIDHREVSPDFIRLGTNVRWYNVSRNVTGRVAMFCCERLLSERPTIEDPNALDGSAGGTPGSDRLVRNLPFAVAHQAPDTRSHLDPDPDPDPDPERSRLPQAAGLEKIDWKLRSVCHRRSASPRRS